MKTKRITAILLSVCLMCSFLAFGTSAKTVTKTAVYGDVDLDGRISIVDATLIQKGLAKIKTLDETQTKAANVDGSDSLGINDATLIQKYLSKILTAFPVGETFTYTTEVEETDWRTSTISYEIFVRSFYDSNGDGIGDFRGVAQKADYLKSLNVGCVWLMPIYKTTSYHGYDVVDYYSVNSELGTINDFDYMVQTLHDNGIKVIIDFVANHTSSSNPWFTSAISSASSPYRDYYIIQSSKGSTGSWHKKNGVYYRGDFSSHMPELNFNNQQVWTEIKNAAGYWLDRNIDGFRLDAAKHIDDNTKVTHAWWRDFESYVKSKNSDAFVVGEVWSDTSAVIKYYSDMDSTFNFDLSTRIMNFANGQSVDLVSAVNTCNTKYKNAASLTPDIPKTTIDSIFLNNHDQTRTVSTLGDSVEKAKLAAAVEMTLPGMPFIYYGEELGQKSNTSDPNRREAMDWYKSASGTGMCNSRKWDTTPKYTVANDGISLEEEINDKNSLYNYYVSLTTIRNNYPIFFEGDYNTVTTSSNIYSYTVTKQDSDYGMFVAHNNTSSSVTVKASVPFTDLLSGKSYSAGDSVTINGYSSLIVNYTGSDNTYRPF